MDGLIIDSEPIWNKSEIDVFATVGVQLTEETCREPTGMRVDEVVEYWYNKFPWQGTDHSKIVEDIFSEVIKRIQLEGKSKPGVKESLEIFKKMGMKIGS